jgi:hypothetical protein
MQENVLLNENNVVISTSRFVVGSQTYAIRNITSVKQAHENPKRGLSYFFLIVAAFFLLNGWAQKDFPIGKEFLVGGIFCVVVAVLIWRARKPVYHIILHSSSGESKALSSGDQYFTSRVAKALNEAIIQVT